jgi:hypothetical protein
MNKVGLNLQAYSVNVLTVEEAMQNSQSAALDAYQSVKAEGGTEDDANEAASEAYLNSLPLLRSRGNIQAHIATVADGVAMGFVTVAQARVLLYAAQLAIRVHAEAR